LIKPKLLKPHLRFVKMFNRASLQRTFVQS